MRGLSTVTIGVLRAQPTMSIDLPAETCQAQYSKEEETLSLRQKVTSEK